MLKQFPGSKGLSTERGVLREPPWRGVTLPCFLVSSQRSSLRESQRPEEPGTRVVPVYLRIWSLGISPPPVLTQCAGDDYVHRLALSLRQSHHLEHGLRGRWGKRLGLGIISFPGDGGDCACGFTWDSSVHCRFWNHACEHEGKSVWVLAGIKWK